MGNVSSRPDECTPLFLRDQSRLTITSLRICSSNNRTLYSVLPNTFPATRYTVRKEHEDDGNIEYVQDPETSPSAALPNILLRLNNDDEIHFYFTLALRQPQTTNEQSPTTSDAIINNLTFVFAPTLKELDTLVTREFNANPNLHKNPNVDLVGDYSTVGRSQEQFEWSWRWRPPKQAEDRGGGWKNSCSFVEYDQRSNRLNTLVTFSFWVQNTARRPYSPTASHALRIDSLAPARIRLPSQRSIESRLSDSDTDMSNTRDATSPFETIPEDRYLLEPTATASTIKVDLAHNATVDGDITSTDDGPVFRATMKTLESKTGSVRTRMKNVLVKAREVHKAQNASNTCMAAFIASLSEASQTNTNAVQPALDHYFEKIAQEILQYEKDNSGSLQKMVIEPLERIYSGEIKLADSKKKEFEDHSREYYRDVSKYLGQRSEKKRAESDSKYETKRRTFELKRFDYSAFMQDLHGGRKDQEVLSHLTRYADAQARGYISTAKKIEALMPQLDALSLEVKEADKQYKLLRSDREEKRRTLEKSQKMPSESDLNGFAIQSNDQVPPVPPLPQSRPQSQVDPYTSASAPTAATYLAEKRMAVANGTGNPTSTAQINTTSPDTKPNPQFGASPSSDRYKGIRDLESTNVGARTTAQRKEGLLWSLSKPNSHMDPRMKSAWHKFWVVLDQGKIAEYINWKSSPEPHMDPIDLRMASVREARNQERRFCFEVITPHFTRVYQTIGEEDLRSWIQAINNALQGAFEGKNTEPAGPVPSSKSGNSIAQNLFGKSSSYHGHRSTSSSVKTVNRYSTVSERPLIQRSRSSEERPAVLLNKIRDRDEGNRSCADCGSGERVEWVSINLGIIVCIECSGIHRSLGTHISKIRSLTLDTNSFTQDVVELIMALGNRVSNLVWEGTLIDRAQKPQPDATRDQRLAFITDKYQHRKYVEPITAGFSHFASADQTLLASVKKNDIQNVIYALALSANPNAADGSRSTHVVYLALAAADPASPLTSPGLSFPSSPSLDVTQQRMAFPVAEVLVQNGAEIPNQQAPIPLSRSALLYVEYKKAQKAGRLTSTASTAHPLVNSSPTASLSTKSSKRSSAGQNVAKFARGAGMLPER